MKNVTFAISVILVAFMTFGLVSSVFAYTAAQTPNLRINIYLDPDTQNAALEAGVIDINDWPLTKGWIDRWALLPSQINLRDYVELGMMEIDINHQMWPTGDDTNKFYKASSAKSVKSVQFRKAVACLLDRDAIVRDVLKGYGFRLDVPVPPFQSAYMDMDAYRTEGLIYDYNTTRAAAILDAAGFTMLPSGTRQDPMTPGAPLAPIIFYIRQDDPNRRKAGEMLTAELRAQGVPVNAIITEKTVCYKNAMVLYNYHLYTGGWSLSTIPDTYYDLYSSYTYYGPSIGWSQNYPGFCNTEFDAAATLVKFPADIPAAQEAAKLAGRLFLNYCAIVPMYSSKAIKAYRTGWTGVVNNAGFGIDNYYTFMGMTKPATDTINWGFKSDIEQLNQVSSEWLWDQNVLGLIYEGIIGTNPFNLAPTEFWIGSAGSVGTWMNGATEATVVHFTLRNNIYWHNETGHGRLLNATDVKFSFDYQYACGPGIAWFWTSLAQMNKTVVIDDTHIDIYYNKKSAWAYQWAGGLPIINPLTWSAVPAGMSAKTYDPANQDANGDGIIDLKQDGTGIYKYVSYSLGNYVLLEVNTDYYLQYSDIETRLLAMFHVGAGDVNKDKVVNILDLSLMARALGTNSGDPHGTNWGQYNPDCEMNGDGQINILDLNIVTANYGKTIG